MLMIPTGITQHDDLLNDLVADANRSVLQEIGLTGVTMAPYTEVFDIEDYGTNSLLLRHRPVQSVVALTDNGALVSAADYYAKEEGVLRLIGDGAEFTTGRQKVSVTYNAGFTSPNLPPEDLALAATLIVAHNYNAGPHAGLRAQRAGSYSVELDGMPIPPQAARILGRYRLPFA